MTELVVPVQPIITWAMDLVFAATGAKLGDSEAPDGLNDLDDPYPYGVIHHIDSNRWGAPLITTDRHLDLIIQIDAVGRRQDQARAFQDRVRSAIVGVDAEGRYAHDPAASVTGFLIKQRSTESGPYPPVGEGERPDRVFTIAERYTIRVVAEEAP